MPETVTALTAESSGVWLVTTQGTQHVIDLDAMTYTRYPNAASRGGAFVADGSEQTIWRIDIYPAIGSSFLIWIDDPVAPETVAHWRMSSTVKSIERVR